MLAIGQKVIWVPMAPGATDQHDRELYHMVVVGSQLGFNHGLFMRDYSLKYWSGSDKVETHIPANEVFAVDW